MKAICKPFNLYFQLNIHFKTDTMKKLLLFAVIALFTSLSQAQSFSRAFANYNGLNNKEAGEIVETANRYYYITAEQGVNGSVLRLLELKKNGDFVRGFKVPISVSLMNSRMLGAKMLIFQNTVMVYLELEGAMNQKLLIASIHLINETVVEYLTSFSSNVSNLSRVVLKDDSVVFCGLKENAGFVRYAFSSNSNAFSERVVDNAVSFTTSEIASNSMCITSSDEYLFCARSQRISRVSSGSLVSSRTINATGYKAKVVTKDNRIIFYNGFKMLLYDLNLDSLGHRNFYGLLQNFDLVSGVDAIYVLQNKTTNKNYLSKLNSSLITLDSVYVPGKSGTVKLKKMGDKIAMIIDCGWHANEFEGTPNGSFADESDLLSVFQYIENVEFPNDYVGDLKSTEYHYYQSGHANNFKRDVYGDGVSGIKERENNIGFLDQSSSGLTSVINGDTVVLTSLYNESPYSSGPHTDIAYTNEFERMKFSYAYSVSRQDIETHLLTFQYPNPTYQPSVGIRNWPAHGDVSKGQAANLAPFVDVNNNGVYEPMLGDYPKIMGDECLLKLYHHPAYLANGTGTDWLQYTFRYNCDTNSILQNTVFIKTQIIPRVQPLTETFFYTFNDFDLGNNTNDYIGTHVDLGMNYCYNADSIDGGSGPFSGFGSKIPAIGNIFLKGVKNKSDGVDNDFGPFNNQSVNGLGFGDGILDNEYWGMTKSRFYTNGAGFPFGNPSSSWEFYNMVHGLLNNGDSIYVNNVSVVQTYFGNSDPLFYASGGLNHGNNFSEITQNNPSGDRRILASSGPGNFAVGDTLEFIQAWIVSLDTTAPSHLNSVEKLFLDAAKIKQYYVQNHIGCGKTFDGIEEDLGLEENERLEALVLYPNPTNGSFRIKDVEQPEMIKAFSGVGAEVKVEMENGSFVLKEASPGIYLIQVHQGPTLRTARLTVF